MRGRSIAPDRLRRMGKFLRHRWLVGRRPDRIAVRRHHAHCRKADRPVFEDWLFHVLFPLAAYIVLALSAFAAQYYARPALFLVGAAALLLLVTGIHNAWDAVTYQVFVRLRRDG